MNLIELANLHSIDYEKLCRRCTVKNPAQARNGNVVISVIIPVRGRTEFHGIVSEYFYQAMENSPVSVSLTYVEHDIMPPKHYWITKPWENHIFVPAQDDEPFNKCLCHNIGALYGPRADYYLFHDVDILVPHNFFSQLLKNLEGRDAVQAFRDQRLLMAERGMTDALLRGVRRADFENYSSHEVRAALPGAPGGSICVSREMLLEVGFWEDVFFTGYSVEDQFFFNKLQLMARFASCNYPPIELMHLWHGDNSEKETKPKDFSILYTFDGMHEGQKRAYIQSRKQYFSKYFSL